jgi:hypothetical protein
MQKLISKKRMANLPELPDDFLAEVSPEHNAVIGRIASSWSAFELMLDEAIWAFMGVNYEIGACVTSQIPNVARRFDAIRSLMVLKKSPDKSLRKLKKLVDQTNRLQRKRNAIVHAVWSSGPTTKENYRLRVKAEKELDFKFEISKLEDLRLILHEINEHKRAVAILLQCTCRDLPTA